MVELKLKSIRNKGKIEERQAKRADSWVKIMEEKAMKVQDYFKRLLFFFSENNRLEVLLLLIQFLRKAKAITIMDV